MIRAAKNLRHAKVKFGNPFVFLPHTSIFPAMCGIAKIAKATLLRIRFWWAQNRALSLCFYAFPYPFDDSIKRGKALAVLVAALAILSVGLPAQAEAASCSNLQRQLASLGGGNKKASTAQYSKSARSQRRQIDKVQSKMSGYGCVIKKGFFSREKHPSCRGLRSTLRRMKRNLNSLERKANGDFGNSRTTARQRKRLIRAIDRQGCDDGSARQANLKRSNILEQIFGKSASKRRRRQAERDRRALARDRKKHTRSGRSTEDRLRNFKTIRTICVRTCDGYYFPVSFSTKKNSFESDFEACNNLCPGTEMQLYYHKTSGQSVEEMISTIDDEPYTSLPNAFAYRETFDPNCACNYRLLDRRVAVQRKLGQEEQNELDRATGQSVVSSNAKPAWRIDLEREPETISSAQGALSDETLTDLDPNQADRRMATGRKVRVVGDAFFPSQ